MLRLQPYRESHGLSVGAVFETIFDESETAYLEKVQHSGLSFVARDRKGQVQAFILVQETLEGFTDYEIAFLGVAPRYRKKGYAERLIQMSLAAAKGRGVWLNVMKENTAACRLYEKLGFHNATETSEGITYVYGVKYECNACKKELNPTTVKWVGENVPRCDQCISL